MILPDKRTQGWPKLQSTSAGSRNLVLEVMPIHANHKRPIQQSASTGKLCQIMWRASTLNCVCDKIGIHGI